MNLKVYKFIIIYLTTMTLHAQNNGELNGRVLDNESLNPISNASIFFENFEYGTITDNEGFFKITEIKPDTYTIRVSHLGYNDFKVYNLIIRSKGNAFLEIQLEESLTTLDEIVVIDNDSSKNKDTPLSIQSLSSVEIETYPGGNNDVIKAVQSLPGIAPVGSYRNELIIRGGAPNESVYYLDGIEVPNINHFMTQGSSGGTVGIVNVSFIQNMTLSRSSFGAEYDNPLSGVLSFEQKKGNVKNLNYNFRIGASEAGLTLNGPLLKGDREYSNTTLIASVRHSYLQFVLGLLGSSVQPQYWDYQWKFLHQFNDNNSLSFIGIGSSDDTRIIDTETTDNFEIAITEQEPVIKQNTHAIGLTWTHQYENSSGNFKLSLSNNKLVNDFSVYEDSINELGAVFQNDAIEEETKVRFHSSHFLNEWKFVYGTNLQISDYTNKTFSPVLEEFQYSTELIFIKYGIFGKTNRSFLNSRLNLSFGIRFDDDTFLKESSLIDTFSPRFSVSYALSKDFKWKLNGSIGRYFKIPVYPILGYQLEGVYVNKLSKYIRSDHYVIGIEYKPKPSTVFSLEVFSKNYAHYPVSLFDNVSLANKGNDFEVLGNEAIVSNGRGKSKGIEFWYQQKLTKQFYATLTYSYFFSEFDTGENSIFLPSLWDSRYIFSFTGGYKLKKNWELSFRYRQAGSTPFPLADEVASISAYPRLIYDYSTLTENKLDGFREGNLRIDKRWNFKKLSFNFYFEIFNVFNQKMSLPDGYALRRNQQGEIVIPEELIQYKTRGFNSPIPSIGLVFDF